MNIFFRPPCFPCFKSPLLSPSFPQFRSASASFAQLPLVSLSFRQFRSASPSFAQLPLVSLSFPQSRSSSPSFAPLPYSFAQFPLASLSFRFYFSLGKSLGHHSGKLMHLPYSKYRPTQLRRRRLLLPLLQKTVKFAGLHHCCKTLRFKYLAKRSHVEDRMSPKH